MAYLAAKQAPSIRQAIKHKVSSSTKAPKNIRTIDLSDLGKSSVMKKMTFSRDGHCLAIVDNPTYMKTDIVVWDMQLNKQQSHIHCPYDYGDLIDHDLLWSRDGKTISFGAKRQWNPITGETLADNPAIGRAARLNKDGSRLLTIVGAIGEPSYIYVYNTDDWSVQKIYVDGFAVKTAAWTAENKILVGVGITNEFFGKSMDGRVITQRKDTGLRLLDPQGTERPKMIWFPAISKDELKSSFTYGFPVGSASKSDFVNNEIVLDAGEIINATTLEIRRYYSYEKEHLSPGGAGMAISPDGRFLYLKGSSYKADDRPTIKNSIVDMVSGQPIMQFDGATESRGGIAISSDGNYLALGGMTSVQIFSLR
jgi:hypothetical protein